MKSFRFQSLIPHLIALVVFAVVAMVFCKPALKGMVLQQSDNIQWKAMYEDQRKVKEETGRLPLWSNGMFSGMPGYQIAIEAKNPIDALNVHRLLTLGLPKPIHFFFLACVSFYILALTLGVNPYLGMVSAISYAYATYHPVIVGAGHDTKMIALAYLPALVGSVHLLFEGRYLMGSALTALFAALLIGANHPQISYYAMLILAAMAVAHIVRQVREKKIPHLLNSLGLALAAGLVGVACNAVVIATTYEYSKESIRGGSVLADAKSPNDKTGLNKEYALSYSLYKSEPLVMMFPRMYGGSSDNLEVSEEKSKAIEALQQMPPELGQQLQGYIQFYWGGITQGTSGPPYVGAIVCFLAILALTVLPNRDKGWMAAVSLLAILMSWGSYFEGFNVFLLERLPMYNKFRAPSMILVIPTFAFAMAAMVGLQNLLFGKRDEKEAEGLFKKGLIATAVVFLLALVVYFTSDFKNETDKGLLEQVSQIQDANQREAILSPVKTFLAGLKEDRQNLFLRDMLRTLFFISVAGVALWLHLRKKINAMTALAVIGLFMAIDILSIAGKYLNEDNYREEEEYSQAFQPAPYNSEIMKDTGYYRVLDVSRGISAAFNGNAITSMFHRSVGGYHAAKLSIYQDLIEKQLYNFPNCMPVVNMLNTKYIIFNDPNSNQTRVQPNPDAAGPCWMVSRVRTVREPSKVMSALDSLAIREEAVIETDLKEAVSKSPGDSVWLVKNEHDEALYRAESAAGGFAVFSEVFYRHGWKAFIDGKEAPILKTNYVLRGLYIPAGKHEVRFSFRPDSYYSSNTASVIASALIWLLLAWAGYAAYKPSRRDSSKSNG